LLGLDNGITTPGEIGTDKGPQPRHERLRTEYPFSLLGWSVRRIVEDVFPSEDGHLTASSLLISENSDLGKGPDRSIARVCGIPNLHGTGVKQPPQNLRIRDTYNDNDTYS